MRKSAVWEVASCGCVLAYSWDAEAPEGKREKTFRCDTVVNDCGCHGEQDSPQDHWDWVILENRRFSAAMAVVQEELGDSTQFPAFRWGRGRRLEIVLPGRSRQKRRALQRKAEAACPGVEIVGE